MGMKVGDLFFELGFTGADKSIGAIAGVKAGVKDAASASLAFKAALVGAFYAVQRLFSASGQVGTDLKNFTSLVGVSAQTLQEYQFAARKVGVSNQEMERTFLNLQQVMFKALNGMGAPSGLARIAEVLGDQLSPEDLEKWEMRPDLMIQDIQKYAQLEENKAKLYEVLGSFNLGDNMKSALVRNAFTPEKMAGAPKYSPREIDALDRVRAAGSELDNTVAMAFGRFNARHGEQLIRDITMIVKALEGLSGAFIKLANKAKLFDGLTEVFKTWKVIFEELTKLLDDIPKAIEFIQDPNKFTKKAGEGELLPSKAGFKEAEEKPLARSILEGFLIAIGKTKVDANKILDREGLASAVEEILKTNVRFLPDMMSPESVARPSSPSPTIPIGPSQKQGSTTNQTFNIDQTMNFSHPGVNPAATRDSVKKAAKDAYQQSSARSQGS